MMFRLSNLICVVTWYIHKYCIFWGNNLDLLYVQQLTWLYLYAFGKIVFIDMTAFLTVQIA